MFSFQLDRDFLAKETSTIKRRAWLFRKVTGPPYTAGVFCLHHKGHVSIYNLNTSINPTCRPIYQAADNATIILCQYFIYPIKP